MREIILDLRLAAFSLLFLFANSALSANNQADCRAVPPFDQVRLITFDYQDPVQVAELLAEEHILFGMTVGMRIIADDEFNKNVKDIGKEYGLFTVPDNEIAEHVAVYREDILDRVRSYIISYVENKNIAANKRTHETAFVNSAEEQTKRQKIADRPWGSPEKLMEFLNSTPESVFLDVSELEDQDIDNPVLLENIKAGRIEILPSNEIEAILLESAKIYFQSNIKNARAYLKGCIFMINYHEKHGRFPTDEEMLAASGVNSLERNACLVSLHMLSQLPSFAQKLFTSLLSDNVLGDEITHFLKSTGKNSKVDPSLLNIPCLLLLSSSDVSEFISALLNKLEEKTAPGFKSMFNVELCVRDAIPEHVISEFKNKFLFAKNTRTMNVLTDKLVLDVTGKTLKDCLNNYFEPISCAFEIWPLGPGNGNRENYLPEKLQAQQQYFLGQTFPPYLRIQLNRFKKNTAQQLVEQNTAMSFPLNLNLADYLISDAEQKDQSYDYELVGIIIHHEENYWFYIKKDDSKKWFLHWLNGDCDVNDRCIKIISEQGKEPDDVFKKIYPTSNVERKNNLPCELLYKKRS